MRILIPCVFILCICPVIYGDREDDSCFDISQLFISPVISGDDPEDDSCFDISKFINYEALGGPVYSPSSQETSPYESSSSQLTPPRVENESSHLKGTLTDPLVIDTIPNSNDEQVHDPNEMEV